MTKSRKNSILKSVRKTSNRVLPTVDKSLKTIGTVTKTVAKTSIPIVEKGISTVYGTMATGFNLGVNTVAKGITKRKGSKKTRRSRTVAGGKLRRKHSRKY
jgi:hypothetical protein